MSNPSSEVRKVADLSLAELKQILSEVIDQKLEEFLLDPDRGMDLRPEVRAALVQSLEDVKAGRFVFSAEEVAERLDLDWK